MCGVSKRRHGQTYRARSGARGWKVLSGCEGRGGHRGWGGGARMGHRLWGCQKEQGLDSGVVLSVQRMLEGP